MGCFASADGYVNIAGPSGRLLHRFCEVIGLPDLPKDPRFDSGAKRSANRAELNALVARPAPTRTTAEWVDALNDAGVPCGPVYAMDEVFADPQVQHLDMVRPRRPPQRGDDGRHVDTVRTAAPALGAHTDEILEELHGHARPGTDQLLCEVDDGIALVTFNNPAKRNALSVEMRTALPGTLRALQADVDVRVVVLTGAGDKAFVSGADISEFGDRRTTPEARAEYDRAAADAGRAWLELEKPIIAMIRGFCIGGGPAHRDAGRHPHRVRRQPVRRAGGQARPRLRLRWRGAAHVARRPGVGERDPLLGPPARGRRGAADRPRQPRRALRKPALRRDGARLLDPRQRPLTVASLKAAIREARRPHDKRDLDRVAAMVEACFRSDDYKEGQVAFLEKRSPSSGEL